MYKIVLCGGEIVLTLIIPLSGRCPGTFLNINLVPLDHMIANLEPAIYVLCR